MLAAISVFSCTYSTILIVCILFSVQLSYLKVGDWYARNIQNIITVAPVFCFSWNVIQRNDIDYF